MQCWRVFAAGVMAAERLQKLLSMAGVCSRRRAEDLLLAGRVQVNGQVARLGDRADPSCDQLVVDGRLLPLAAPPLVLLLNKPPGVVCSCATDDGFTTVLELLPPDLRQGQGLHPVGRLDVASRGALLLTNHGALTLRLTHPRYGHRKTYRVWLRGQPDAGVLRRWRAGVPLDGRPSQPVAVTVLQQCPDRTQVELVMGEGRNRQIRRTAELLGYPVLDLQRTAIDGLQLGALPEGRWRRLQAQEWEPWLQS